MTISTGSSDFGSFHRRCDGCGTVVGKTQYSQLNERSTRLILSASHMPAIAGAVLGVFGWLVWKAKHSRVAVRQPWPLISPTDAAATRAWRGSSPMQPGIAPA